MREATTILYALIFGLIMFSCAIDDEDRCGDDFFWSDGGCYELDDGSLDADSDADSDADGGNDFDPELWIGSSCSCQGDECENMGAPVPNGGTIVGCEEVPADWVGADKSCLRSYGGTYAPQTHYANGYCSLLATSCEGATLICDASVIGDFEAMTACPIGTAMIQSNGEVTVASMTATIHSKSCAILCDSNDDCRIAETDPVWEGEATQYQCVDKGGVKFCQDPRNLSEDYTAQAF